MPAMLILVVEISIVMRLGNSFVRTVIVNMSNLFQVCFDVYSFLTTAQTCYSSLLTGMPSIRGTECVGKSHI